MTVRIVVPAPHPNANWSTETLLAAALAAEVANHLDTSAAHTVIQITVADEPGPATIRRFVPRF